MIAASLGALIASTAAMIARLKSRFNELKLHESYLEEIKYNVGEINELRGFDSKNNKKAEFLNLLEKAVIANEKLNIEDLLDIYSGHYEVKMPKLDEILYSLKYLKNGFYLKGNIEFLDRINTLIKVVKEKIQIANSKEPFKNLPERERVLLTDIYEISVAKEKEILSNKLLEIASLIYAREAVVEKISRDQGKSLKLTIWAFWLSIIFFLFSTAYTYLTRN